MEIINAAHLKMAILELEQKKLLQEQELVSQLHSTYNSLKPVNLLKSTLRDIGSEPNLGKNIFNALIGLGTGVISKKLVIGGSHNIFKKLMGVAVEFGVAGLVTKKGEVIKSVIASTFKKLLAGRKMKPKQLFDERALY